MHNDEMGPHVEEGVRSGAQVIAVLTHAALGGSEMLHRASSAVTADQARWGLACTAWWDAQTASSAVGVRLVVDDPVLDELRAAAAGGFASVHAAVLELAEGDLRAALANLIWLHVQMRHNSATAALN
ncbi:MAG TPA: hypothetical protein VGM33_12720 [Baekduia sp.]|jgi:hypothetical protein